MTQYVAINIESTNESEIDLSVRLVLKSKNDFMLKMYLTKVFTIYIYIYIIPRRPSNE
jgi:hypothetical protein